MPQNNESVNELYIKELSDQAIQYLLNGNTRFTGKFVTLGNKIFIAPTQVADSAYPGNKLSIYHNDIVKYASEKYDLEKLASDLDSNHELIAGGYPGMTDAGLIIASKRTDEKDGFDIIGASTAFGAGSTAERSRTADLARKTLGEDYSIRVLDL